MSLCNAKPGKTIIMALLCALTLAPLPDRLTAAEVSKNDLNSLLNWAVHLSGYDKPARLPRVQFVDHHYLVLRACQARECAVIGWYNDENIIYLDQSLARLETLMQRSVLVHEMVHYLQHQSGQYTASCADSTRREREAYEVQRQFFYAYGALSPIRQHHYAC